MLLHCFNALTRLVYCIFCCCFLSFINLTIVQCFLIDVFSALMCRIMSCFVALPHCSNVPLPPFSERGLSGQGGMQRGALHRSLFFSCFFFFLLFFELASLLRLASFDERFSFGSRRALFRVGRVASRIARPACSVPCAFPAVALRTCTGVVLPACPFPPLARQTLLRVTWRSFPSERNAGVRRKSEPAVAKELQLSSCQYERRREKTTPLPSLTFFFLFFRAARSGENRK